MDKQQTLVANRFGFSVTDIGTPVRRMTFYNASGEALILPADTYHMERYLKRGFTLTPKAEGLPTLEASAGKNTSKKRKYRLRKKGG